MAADEEKVARFREVVRRTVAPFVEEVPRWRSTRSLPGAFIHALGAAGIFRTRWAEGAARGFPFASALTEELVELDGGVALAVSLHSEMFLGALVAHGGDRHAALRERALDGTAVGCAAATEVGGGSDLTAMQTTAQRAATGWRLVGEKRYTTNANQATHAIVYARASDVAPPGVTAFLVPLARPGVGVRAFFPTLGVRASGTCRLRFDVELPEDAVVGRPGTGLTCFMQCVRSERLLTGVWGLHTARLALRLARAFMRSRSQFGTRLYDLQALRHRFVDAWVEVDAAQAYLDATVERVVGGSFVGHHEIAALKMHTAGIACRVLDECIQFFGGRGYTEHFPIERFWRDSRLLRIGGGTDELMREYVGQGLDTDDEEAEQRLRALQEIDEMPFPA